MKCNMTNIFLEKSYTIGVRETSPRPYFKRSNLKIALDQQSNFTQFVFIVCPSRELPKYIETMILTTWFYLI